MRNAIILLLLLGIAAFGACSSTPDDPAFDNPFDPNGTNPGGGYGLVVTTGTQAVVLTWDNLPGMNSYKVEWSDSSTDPGDWELLEEQLFPPEATPKIVYTHEGFTAEKTNWYRVTGFVQTDGALLPAAIPSSPVAVDIQALVSPSGGALSTPTRFIEVDVLTGVADSLELSNEPDFANSTTFPVTPGSWTPVPWTLPGASVENRTDLSVHYRTRMAQSVGAADSFSIQVLFAPALEVQRGLRSAPGGLFMVDSLQVLTFVPVNGQSLGTVVRNRWNEVLEEWEFVEDLTPATIADPVEVRWDPLVEEFVNAQLVATLNSDFGFADSTTIELQLPEALGDPEIEIVGGTNSTTRDIQVFSIAANAGYVALSENADFAGTTYVTWSDTLDYQLEDVFGTRFLYAAYSNPILAETKVTSTLVSLVSPPARARR